MPAIAKTDMYVAPGVIRPKTKTMLFARPLTPVLPLASLVMTPLPIVAFSSCDADKGRGYTTVSTGSSGGILFSG
jgi:hypothetical protein